MSDNEALSLYEIDDQLRQLEHEIIDAAGVLDEDLEERLDELLDRRDAKMDGYIAVIRELETTAEAVKSEEKRLKKRRRALENSVDSLKDRLAFVMKRRGEEVRESKLGKIRLQQASKRSLIVDVDEDELPDALKRIKISADKKALRELLESEDEEFRREGEQYAHLDEPSYYIRLY